MMGTHARPLFVATATVAVVLLALTSTALATTGSVTSKTINTTNGDCVNSGNPPTLADGRTACGAAVYGPYGFTGHIHGSGQVNVVDYLCTHIPGAGSFVSFGGTYTFTAYDASNAPLGSATYTVTGGIDCTDGTVADYTPSGGLAVDFAANGGVIGYSLTLAGVTSANAQATFSGYNSIFNRAKGIGDAQANSPSVAPPGPPADLPEAPASVLLLLTAGLVGLVFIRRQRAAATQTAA
jgi:hypothetical protein